MNKFNCDIVFQSQSSSNLKRVLDWVGCCSIRERFKFTGNCNLSSGSCSNSEWLICEESSKVVVLLLNLC